MSDDGESSQLAGIGTQATLSERTACAFEALTHHNGPGSSPGLSICRVENDAVTARFEAWLALVKR